MVRNLVVDHIDRFEANHSFAPATRELLQRHRIGAHDPEEAAERLETTARTQPDPATPLALAELWYRAGLRKAHGDRSAAMLGFRNAAAGAALMIESPVPCDENYERAVEVHNDAVVRLLRLSAASDEALGFWRETLAGVGVEVAAERPFVDPARFASVKVAKDIRVEGMRRRFRGEGLGVPVLGVRESDRANPIDPAESYFPKKLMIGATATASPGGSLVDGSWRTAPLTLNFHDPFQGKSVVVGGRTLRMAWDTTTALAVQAGRSELARATSIGLLNSELPTGMEAGLYMLRPYQPGKMPLVFVHGLNSNPDAFVQTLNEFRNDPVLSERYQFMLFAYPTGRPIVTSAVRLRRALYDAETKFGSDPAFHSMTLVGHSMGGNLSRCMVTDSGRVVWDAHMNVSYESLLASPETKALLAEALIFRPVPFVRRVVFIAAPHRGSPVADGPVGWVVSRLIEPPSEQTALVKELKALNGPDVFKRESFKGGTFNSIGALSRRSPTLRSVSQLPIALGVSTHSIIFNALAVLPTDLVVLKSSSSLPGVESERVLPGTHFSEQSRGAVEELRRILSDPSDPAPS